MKFRLIGTGGTQASNLLTALHHLIDLYLLTDYDRRPTASIVVAYQYQVPQADQAVAGVNDTPRRSRSNRITNSPLIEHYD